MAVYKNASGQHVAVFAYDADGAGVTGDAANITAYLSKDAGTPAATNDANPTELDATNMPGVYIFDLTQAESNADMLVLVAASATSGVSIDPVVIYTEPEVRQADTVQIEGGDATDVIDARLAASGLSTLTAQQVWEYATRTLTSFGTLAADVWSAATRTLTSAANITTTGAATVPQSGDAYAELGGIAADAAAARAFARGKYAVDLEARTVTFYDSDDTTPLFTLTYSADYKTRTVT